MSPYRSHLCETFEVLNGSDEEELVTGVNAFARAADAHLASERPLSIPRIFVRRVQRIGYDRSFPARQQLHAQDETGKRQADCVGCDQRPSAQHHPVDRPKRETRYCQHIHAGGNIRGPPCPDDLPSLRGEA